MSTLVEFTLILTTITLQCEPAEPTHPAAAQADLAKWGGGKQEGIPGFKSGK